MALRIRDERLNHLFQRSVAMLGRDNWLVGVGVPDNALLNYAIFETLQNAIRRAQLYNSVEDGLSDGAGLRLGIPVTDV